MDNFAVSAILWLSFLVVIIVVALLPAIIAFRRKHAYKWIILILSLFASWTGIIWILAFVWAVWPQEKSALDPVMGNPTGLGRRNAGDTMGSAAYGQERGYATEREEDERAYRQNPPRS